MSNKEGFGPGLRAHRERRGLTIESIAKSTKIKASLLAALEHNDVSQWPAGIFRRAFLRSYANAVGLPSEPLLSDFQRYFPEEGTPDPELWLGEEPPSSLRLEFADVGEDPGLARAKVWAAGLELCAVLLFGGLVSNLAGTGFWMTSGAAALVYYPLATGLTGRTIQFSALRRPSWLTWTGTGSEAEGQSLYEDDPQLPLREPDEPGLQTDAETPGDEFRPPQTAVH